MHVEDLGIIKLVYYNERNVSIIKECRRLLTKIGRKPEAANKNKKQRRGIYRDDEVERE